MAAGRGVRAGAGMPKQFRPVAGTPLVLRAVAPFLEHPDVTRVALVVPPDALDAPPEWLAASARHPRVTLVAGGAERADSVRLGLAVLPASCARVLVHDAARPFADRALIDRVLDTVAAGESAVPAVPVADTLKRGAGDPPRVAGTVPRDALWRVQTPQGFPREVLDAAHRDAAGAAGDTASVTDDATLVERLGRPVRLVPGSPWNIKVTTADDFELAERLARGDGT